MLWDWQNGKMERSFSHGINQSGSAMPVGFFLQWIIIFFCLLSKRRKDLLELAVKLPKSYTLQDTYMAKRLLDQGHKVRSSPKPSLTLYCFRFVLWTLEQRITWFTIYINFREKWEVCIWNRGENSPSSRPFTDTCNILILACCTGSRPCHMWKPNYRNSSSTEILRSALPGKVEASYVLQKDLLHGLTHVMKF